MGRTHAIGGAAGLAIVVAATDSAATMPLWGYGLAALAALVPDADNGAGTILNRLKLQPVRILAYPIWAGNPPHRGRTHSLLFAGLFGLLLAGYVYLIDLALVAIGGERLPMQAIVTAGVAGYVSHLVLDLLNTVPISLFYPLPLRVVFPPWRARGFIPGRFEVNTFYENLVTVPLLLLVLAIFFLAFGPDVLAATRDDGTIGSVAALVSEAVRGLIGLIRSL